MSALGQEPNFHHANHFVSMLLPSRLPYNCATRRSSFETCVRLAGISEKRKYSRQLGSHLVNADQKGRMLI